MSGSIAGVPPSDCLWAQRTGRLVNGFADAGKSAAAACDVPHGLVDIGIGWMTMAIKQRCCRDQLSALTVAALHDIAFDPGLFQRASLCAVQSLDCDDTRFENRGYRYLASRPGGVIEQDSAGAANADTATEFGTRQLVFAPEYPEQGRVGGGMHDDGFPVNTD